LNLFFLIQCSSAFYKFLKFDFQIGFKCSPQPPKSLSSPDFNHRHPRQHKHSWRYVQHNDNDLRLSKIQNKEVWKNAETNRNHVYYRGATRNYDGLIYLQIFMFMIIDIWWIGLTINRGKNKLKKKKKKHTLT